MLRLRDLSCRFIKCVKIERFILQIYHIQQVHLHPSTTPFMPISISLAERFHRNHILGELIRKLNDCKQRIGKSFDRFNASAER